MGYQGCEGAAARARSIWEQAVAGSFSMTPSIHCMHWLWRLHQQVRSGRGPNRALLRLLVDKYAHLVVYVDEYYTSQVRMCS